MNMICLNSKKLLLKVKKNFMFETLTHSFADLGSTACSLVIILFLVVV